MLEVQIDKSFLQGALIKSSCRLLQQYPLCRGPRPQRPVLISAYLSTPRLPARGPELKSIQWMEERIRAVPQWQPLWSLQVQALIFKISSLLFKEPVKNCNGTLFYFAFKFWVQRSPRHKRNQNARPSICLLTAPWGVIDTGSLRTVSAYLRLHSMTMAIVQGQIMMKVKSCVHYIFICGVWLLFSYINSASYRKEVIFLH